MSEFWRLRPNQEQLERLQKAIKKYGTQGEIILPKEDKYEEFKKWFKNQNELMWYAKCHNVHFGGDEPFKMFEKELEEKEKEETIKKIIKQTLENICKDDGVYNKDEKANIIYNSLSRGGYLK